MIKLGIIFGGKSTEHNVSVVSATSIIYNLDKKKYDIYPVYIDKDGNYYKYLKKIDEIEILKMDDKIVELEPIINIFEYLKDIDIVFPVLHGLYGEDGTIQGMLELMNKKYVGCKVLSSSLCMDKAYTKVLFRSCDIEQAKSMYITKYKEKYIYIDNNFNRTTLTKEELKLLVEEYLKYPVFIKPSNSGSSIGVNKASNDIELEEYLNQAFLYDSKVLIEETIIGREVECAILGNDDLTISNIGEVKSAEDFYTYDSKYKNKKSNTLIPTDIDLNISNKIKEIAKKAYYACDCKGLARVDFFIENNTNRIILNEINTMPGFTEISMYPKLMEEINYSYSKLLDKLISLGLDRTSN